MDICTTDELSSCCGLLTGSRAPQLAVQQSKGGQKGAYGLCLATNEPSVLLFVLTGAFDSKAGRGPTWCTPKVD